MKARYTLTLRLFLRLLPLLVLAAAVPWILAFWVNQAWWLGVISAVILLALMWWTLNRALAPLHSLFRALSTSVGSYRDGEYNFGVNWQSDDELGDLVATHAELGEVLREQRQGLAQRELLLDTMVQNTPVAMVLLAEGNQDERRVVYANLAARKLLHDGRKMEGASFDSLLSSAPDELLQALERGADGLFAISHDEVDGEEQVYHLARRSFRLNGRKHELLLLRLLTSELRRQEVQTWKKVIRVISHELNNSLAPIASLAHSGAELTRRGRHDRLDEVFATIEGRARHLEGFIRGYARFAKLPQPQMQHVSWQDFLNGLRQHIPFTLEMTDKEAEARMDRAQMEQAMLNLLKNAHEAGDATDNHDVRVRVIRLPEWWRIEVLDNGHGMNDAVLQNALVPFYSTKRNGTGLGLALTREIVEAHDGHLSLHNRKSGGLCVSIQLPANA